MGPVTARQRAAVLSIFSVVALLVGGSVRSLDAQTASASALKAAFLFNFAKFAEWPSLAPGAPVRVCVTGDPLVATALADVVRGHSLESHDLQAVELASTESARDCHVLFVGGAEAGRLTAELGRDASELAVLTVSDIERFAQIGGMVELFVEGGRMKFAINVDAVQRSRVRLSSRLLSLARIVRDAHGS